MLLPPDHTQRRQLNDEVHARPPESLVAPVRVSYLALLDAGKKSADLLHIRALAEEFGRKPPADGAVHYSADFGDFRLKWERHTEFSRFKIITPGDEDAPVFTDPPIGRLPPDWLRELPGSVMTATDVDVRQSPDTLPEPEDLSRDAFRGYALIGANIAAGRATAYTDLRIHEDGFTRLLIFDRGLVQRQLGRYVQRILEIDTYRMMALLAFPIARGYSPKLSQYEQELAEITTEMATDASLEEPRLLDRLTRLQAAIESGYAANDYRFSAARAYNELVHRRIEELREERLEGLQTFKEFTERRLMPAMNTCLAVARRQEDLSRRVARATQLLSTRVDVAGGRQNQEVLATMARRAQLQLRLQQTVEGLSVAAVTYYVVSLVSYAAKAFADMGLPINPGAIVVLSIPVVGGLVWWGVHRVRRSLEADDKAQDVSRADLS